MGSGRPPSAAGELENSRLASCLLGLAIVHGLGILTELYVIYISFKAVNDSVMLCRLLVGKVVNYDSENVKNDTDVQGVALGKTNLC